MSKALFKQYANTFVGARVPANGRPIANNTRLFKRGEDCYAIRLHNTDVVTVFADGRLVLDTGGWKTMTTKDRIGSFSPVSIWSDRGVWYVKHPKAPKAVPFVDGMMFTARGRVVNGITAAQWTKYLRERAAMQKRIQDYCTKFNRALATTGLPMPGSGDCWFCSMQTDDGTSLGDQTDDSDHLLSHMEEDYFVPSLAVNALRAKRYNDTAIYMFLCMDPENDRMGGEGSHYRASDGSMGGNTVRRALVAYLYDRLLPDPPGQQSPKRPLRAVKSTGF